MIVVLVANEMVGMEQRFLDEVANMLVVGDVEDVVALTAGSHQSRQAQLGQVLGDRRGLGTDVLG